MAKDEIITTDCSMFPDMLKKSNFLISSVYRATLLENKVLALALTKVTLNEEGRPVATLKDPGDQTGSPCDGECHEHLPEGCGHFPGGTDHVCGVGGRQFPVYESGWRSHL